MVKAVKAAEEININLFDVKEDYYRTMALNIDDSYSHEWDILAELIQNAADAIRQRSGQEGDFKGRIEIIVDHDKKSLTVKDNGVGFAKNKTPDYLRLFSSGKQKDERTVGEKGVGLKFAIFSGDTFELSSNDGKNAIVAKSEGALSWKLGKSEELPSIRLSKGTDIPRGTVITLGKMGDHPVFSWSLHQLKFALLTKTALGDVRALWDAPNSLSASLKVKKDGEETHNDLDCQYLLPLDVNQKDSKLLSVSEFDEFAQKTNRRDEEKRNKIYKKILYIKRELGSGEKICAVFLPARELWKDYSHSFGLKDDEIESREELSFRPGIYVSIKGMPTGIRVEPPQTGQSGYWQNIALVVDFNQLKFDIGRKSLTGRQVEKVRKVSKDIFNEFTKIFVAWGTEKGPIVTGDWLADAEQLIGQIESLAKIDVGVRNRILMERDPSKQEASVSAIFFELLGMGMFPNFIPVSVGYKNQYDFYARAGDGKLKMFEFKSRLRNIFGDFEEMTKEANQIDVLICWDVDDEDKEAAEQASITLIEGDGDDRVAATFYSLATHYLKFPGGKVLPVIDLKRLIAKFNE